MSVVEDFIKKLKNLNERRNLAARKKLAVSHLVERHCVKPLTAEQKKDICDFWERVSGTKKKYFDFLWYEVYNGVCQDPAKLKYYIPNDFYYCYVDYFFANDHYGRRFDDKTLYQLYFPEIKHPETIVRKSGEDMLDSQYQIISIDKAMQLCHEAGTVIYKSAREASGGKSIRFWSVGDDELFLCDTETHPSASNAELYPCCQCQHHQTVDPAIQKSGARGVGHLAHGQQRKEGGQWVFWRYVLRHSARWSAASYCHRLLWQELYASSTGGMLRRGEDTQLSENLLAGETDGAATGECHTAYLMGYCSGRGRGAHPGRAQFVLRWMQCASTM